MTVYFSVTVPSRQLSIYTNYSLFILQEKKNSPTCSGDRQVGSELQCVLTVVDMPVIQITLQISSFEERAETR